MTAKLVLGIDGKGGAEGALNYAKRLAGLIGDCELLIVYVIEWSPFSFQTSEENEKRHNRREEEISIALERVVDPAVNSLTEAGIKARGIVRHGNVADILNTVSVEEKAEQIIVNRTSESGISTRLFGSSTGNLVMSASVPVTVVG
ncbi:MAG: universal stress protein [Hyphomicrobiales bacterium]